MGNSLLAVRDINHKYIVVERNYDVFSSIKHHTQFYDRNIKKKN